MGDTLRNSILPRRICQEGRCDRHVLHVGGSGPESCGNCCEAPEGYTCQNAYMSGLLANCPAAGRYYDSTLGSGISTTADSETLLDDCCLEMLTSCAASTQTTDVDDAAGASAGLAAVM